MGWQLQKFRKIRRRMAILFYFILFLWDDLGLWQPASILGFILTAHHFLHFKL
jgi:hypothetical protein